MVVDVDEHEIGERSVLERELFGIDDARTSASARHRW
jgi:hypothetical protein